MLLVGALLPRFCPDTKRAPNYSQSDVVAIYSLHPIYANNVLIRIRMENKEHF